MVNGTFLYETSWLLIFARWAEKGLSLTSSSCEKNRLTLALKNCGSWRTMHVQCVHKYISKPIKTTTTKVTIRRQHTSATNT